MKHLLFLLCFFPFGVHCQCNASLWSHVYHPERFTKEETCKTVRGTVLHVKKSEDGDGDYHIQLKLDPGQENLINQANIDHENGCLVVEIICAIPPTKAASITACHGCTNRVRVPNKNKHIEVTGTYVEDEHGNHGWREIHPVSKIKVL
jgi:hypothetical protein